MNLFIIERYIQKIKKEDIYNYAKSQGIILTTNEVDTLYYYLKTYYKTFLTNPKSQLELLSEIKSQVSTPVATKLDELYYRYQNKL